MEKFVQSKSSVILNTIGLTRKILQGCKASTNKKKRLSHVGTTPKKNASVLRALLHCHLDCNLVIKFSTL